MYDIVLAVAVTDRLVISVLLAFGIDYIEDYVGLHQDNGCHNYHAFDDYADFRFDFYLIMIGKTYQTFQTFRNYLLNTMPLNYLIDWM